MEEIFLFVLSIFFGAFLFILVSESSSAAYLRESTICAQHSSSSTSI
jgi:hypothetical protein